MQSLLQKGGTFVSVWLILSERGSVCVKRSTPWSGFSDPSNLSASVTPRVPFFLTRWASVPFVFSYKETCNRIYLLLCLHKNRLFLALKPSFVIIQNWIMHFNIAVFSIYAGQIHTYLRIIRGAVLQFPFQTPKMPQNRTNLSQNSVLMPKRGIFLTR